MHMKMMREGLFLMENLYLFSKVLMVTLLLLLLRYLLLLLDMQIMRLSTSTLVVLFATNLWHVIA
ncbi:hypothetical protein ACJX0J_021005 [Zea mays]